MYSGPLPYYGHFSFHSKRVVVGEGDERGEEVEDRNGRKGMERWRKRNKNYE
jgi:hypothetical protein